MKVLISIIFLAIATSQETESPEFSSDVVHIEPITNFNDVHAHSDHNANNKVRCTRRYTPGYCPGLPVQSVWTYMAFYQNCTERMGCPAERYVNRFGSYAECLIQCRQMNIMYSHALSKYYTKPNKENNETALTTIDQNANDDENNENQ